MRRVRPPVPVGLVLLQVLVLMPLFLGGAVLALDSFYQRRAASVFADPARCVVNVEYVSEVSRTGDPLYVVTDGGDCARSEQYLVAYVGVPVDQRLTEGELEVELGTTADGLVVARPASVTNQDPEVSAVFFWTGVGLAAVGALLEVAWVLRVRRSTP